MELNIQQLTLNKKWVIQILFVLYDKNKYSYKNLKNIISIPNSTLSLRVNEMVKYGYLKRFVYGSISKPHYTEYKITDLGLEYVDNLLGYMNIQPDPHRFDGDKDDIGCEE